MWKTWACPLLLCGALATGAASPAEAVHVAVIDSAFEHWPTVTYPSGPQPSPVSISGESSGSGPGAFLDLEFEVSTADQADTDQVVSFEIHVTNQGPLSWGGYVFALGFDLGEDFTYATFMADPEFFILTDPVPTSSVFGNFEAFSAMHPHEVRFSDGNMVAPGSSVNFQIAVHVPLPAPQMDTFTLRQYAVAAIPEPATVLLMGLGLVALGYAGRRKLVS